MVSYRFAIHYVLYYRYSATVHLHVQEQEKCLDSYSCLILLGYVGFFFSDKYFAEATKWNSVGCTDIQK